MWTTRRLLTWTADHFTAKGIDSPRLCAEMLLAHVLGVSRLNLYVDMERPASDAERAAYRELISRAASNEPVDYLTGRAPFFSMLLRVTKAVLIPRPSTETLVEHVIQHARRTAGFLAPTILELGTGSGAIAIALAKHIPGSQIVATDVSAEALAVAQTNCREQSVDASIDFQSGNMFEAIPADLRAQYVVSNPPYISDEEWRDVPPNVKHYEPHIALRGGNDGLQIICQLLEVGPDRLARPGQLVIEFAASQRDTVLKQAEQDSRLQNARILHDHEGLPRVLVADAT